MEEERRGRRGLTRRQVLIGGAAVGAAAALGVTGDRLAVPRRAGWDGLLLAPVRRRRRRAPDEDPRRDRVRHATSRSRTDPALGQPLLHEARAGRSAAAARRRRLPPHPDALPRPAGLLQELTPDLLERYGLTPTSSRAPWKAGRSTARRTRSRSTPTRSSSTTTPSSKKAGLLARTGRCPPIESETTWSTPTRAKKVTGETGRRDKTAACPWRMFLTLYSQLGGRRSSPTAARIDMDERAIQGLSGWRSHTRGDQRPRPRLPRLGRQLREPDRRHRAQGSGR